MNNEELQAIVAECLQNFYSRRLNSLSTLSLKATLRKKNPYLFRACGMQLASEIVGAILTAHINSSDETIFGDAFFEPLVIYVSKGVVSPSEGVDIAIETATVYKAISVKSGPNIFNSSQSKRQSDEFETLRRRLVKLQKQFDPVLGTCYGKGSKPASDKRCYRIISGQAFWYELTGKVNFYQRICNAMSTGVEEHRRQYEEEYSNALNRFTREFLLEFAKDDGAIDWNKLLQFNSGAELAEG